MPFLISFDNSSKNIEINISSNGIFEDFRFAILKSLNGDFFKVFNIFIKISFDLSSFVFGLLFSSVFSSSFKDEILGNISIVVPSFVCITPT